MFSAGTSWDGWSVLRYTAIALMVLALPVAGSARANNQIISATVAPSLGIGMDAYGNLSQGGATVDVSVTRERRGDLVVVTVMPQG